MSNRRMLELVLLVALAAPGCGYLESRARDLADVVRVSVGCPAGFTYGEGVRLPAPCFLAEARAMQVGWGVGFAKTLRIGIEHKGRGGIFEEYEYAFPVTTILWLSNYDNNDYVFGYWSYYRATASVADPDYKHDALYFIGLVPNKEVAPVTEYGSRLLFADMALEDYFWIEGGAAALVVSVRVGLNPAELLDFIAGFATLDIFGDDGRGRAAPERPLDVPREDAGKGN